MKPTQLMILGVSCALVGIVTAIIQGADSPATLIFAGGALFGKGYGIWEERSER